MKKTNSGYKIWSVAIVLMVLTIGTAAALPSISVIPNTNSVNPGQNFTVQINTDPDGNPIYSDSFIVGFNPAMLEVLATNKIVHGDFLSQDGADSIPVVRKIDNTNGTVEYGGTRVGVETGVTNPGTLVSIEFHVKNSATPGMSSILGLSDVNLVKINGTNFTIIPDVIVNNGSAKIPCNALVTITKPAEGEVLATQTVNVNYQESGCLNLVSKAILQLDNDQEVSDDGNDGVYSFAGVDLGVHAIKVWLADQSGIKQPGAFDIVNFSIALKSPKISVIPQQQTVMIGDTVTVNITIDPDTLAVYGASFDLSYISSMLNATKIEKGSFLTQDGAESIMPIKKCDNSINKCTYGESRIQVTTGVTTPGILATITFRADSAGTVNLDLSNATLVDPSSGEIGGLVSNNGKVVITEIPPTYVKIAFPLEGEVIQGQTVNVNYVESGFLSKVNHADLKLDNEPIVHDTDNDGNYAFNVVSFGQHKIQVWLVDSSDVQIAGAYDIVNFTNIAPTHGPKINVTPAYKEVYPGDIIKINITLNPDTKESYAASVKLLFNTTMLEALNIVGDGVLSQDGASTIVGTKKFDNANGTVEYAESRAGTDTGVLNEGTLFQLVFRVKPAVRGSIGQIDLTLGEVLDPDLNLIPGVTLNDGEVVIPLNKLPVAIAKTNHSKNNVGYNVYLDGSDSYDTDGSIIKYEWDFDDGTATGLGPVVKHVYSNYRWDGTAYLPYVVKLTVTDNEHAVATKTIEITPMIAGDTNGNGAVNIFDLAQMGKSWDTKNGDPKYSDGADMNNDNVVNVLDLVILGLHWGNTA